MTTTTEVSFPSNHIQVVVFMVVVLVGGYWQWKNTTKRHSKRLLAPVAPTTVWESLSQLGGPTSIWFFRRLARTMDTWVYRLPLGIVIVGDTKVARRIHQEADKWLHVYRNFDKVVGHSNVFTSSTHAALWKLHRKTLAPAFSNREVARMNRICVAHCERWCSKFLRPLADADADANNDSDATNTTTFDPDHEMSCLTIGVIAEAAFEYQMTREETLQYLEDYNTAMPEFMVRQLSHPWRYFISSLLSDARRAQTSALGMRALAKRMLEHYRKQESASNNKNNNDTTSSAVPNTLIRLIEAAPFTEEEKIAELCVTLVGGFDTTGSFLANAVNHLAHHPHVLQELRADLARVNHVAQDSPYLQYFIKESYRLTPVGAFGSSRVAPRDYEYEEEKIMEKGTKCSISRVIPKGSIMVLPHILPLHNAHIFPNPDTFNPQRWASPTPEMTEASALMFSQGPRNCVGQALAVAEINSVLPYLVRHFDLVEVQPGQPDFFLTLKLVQAKIQPRHADAASTTAASDNTP